jgi:phosphoribosyl 1,2-cyclic phosphodiesterase
LRVRSLYSGSSGNSYLVQTDHATLLVDAGGTRKRLVDRLRECGVTPADLTAILVTHEHSDHVGAIAMLRKVCPAPVVANAATLQAAGLAAGPCVDLDIGATRDFSGIVVTSFATPHDAAASAGYLLRADDCTVAIATDLGHVPAGVAQLLRGADLLVLEANHDAELLRVGPYPLHLKRRILGPRGHLSNDQSAALAVDALSGRPQRLWLAHLSAENNRPTLAKAAVEASLLAAGADAVNVEVLDRHHVGPLFESGREVWQRRLF